MFLKRLFYASASILMLALAFRLGAGSATAQAPGNPVVAAGVGSWSGPYTVFVATANGDIYAGTNPGAWFSGSTPGTQTTFGQLKATYRK
jgi:hypothetical protein